MASPHETKNSGARSSAAVNAGMPPRAGSMPHPWPLVSPDHANTTSRAPLASSVALDGVKSEPEVQSDARSASKRAR
jgi:hypothetical protein